MKLDTLACAIGGAAGLQDDSRTALDERNKVVLECLRDINSQLRMVGGTAMAGLYYLPDLYAEDAGRIAAALRRLSNADFGGAVEELKRIWAIVNAGALSPDAHEI